MKCLDFFVDALYLTLMNGKDVYRFNRSKRPVSVKNQRGRPGGWVGKMGTSYDWHHPFVQAIFQDALRCKNMLIQRANFDRVEAPEFSVFFASGRDVGWL